MGKVHRGDHSGLDQPREAKVPQPEAEDAASHMTIEDAIWLTAQFDKEWFRSFDTLDADLSRFAAAYRLSSEQACQVRRVIEALHEGEDTNGCGQEHPRPQLGPPAGENGCGY